jgi:hypothetical protein
MQHQQQSAPIAARQHRTLTERSIERIYELVELDVALISQKTTEGKPGEALQAAQQAYERRRPLVEWLVRYNVDKARLKLLEAADNCTLVHAITPAAAANLQLDLAALQQSLAEQRSRLSRTLWALQPALRQRLLEAAHDQPRLIPSILSHSAESSLGALRWRLKCVHPTPHHALIEETSPPHLHRRIVLGFLLSAPLLSARARACVCVPRIAASG